MAGALWVGLTLQLLVRPRLPFAIDETCPSIRIFGLHCPFCGGTRAAEAFFTGHFFDALGWSPLAFALLTSLCLLTLTLPVLWLRPPQRFPKVPVGKVLIALLGIQFAYQLFLNSKL
jgi:hypothetical protein